MVLNYILVGCPCPLSIYVDRNIHFGALFFERCQRLVQLVPQQQKNIVTEKSCRVYLDCSTFLRKTGSTTTAIPWVAEVFLACGENFRCWPKADTSSAVGRTETGNRARKVSGTQGTTAKYSCDSYLILQLSCA